jgi:hypothetical protein
LSTGSTIPFYGRAWALTITPSTGPSAGTPIVVTSDSFEPEALRMTFEIEQYAFSAYWQAEITIYNANGPITSGPSAGINLYQAVIQEGDLVTVAAGYQADYPYPSTPPIIWSGPVFYTIQDRLDVVDQRLILHCILNRALTTQNFINDTAPALSTQFTQAQIIASKSVNSIGIDQNQMQRVFSGAVPQRTAVNLPRGKSYFGNPHHYLQLLADQNNALSWFDRTHCNFDTLQFPTGPLITTYSPVNVNGGPPQRVGGVTLSLIGQPQQTQFGANIRVLLDPRVQIVSPLPQVGILLRFVRQAPISYPIPKGQIPPLPLPGDGQYVVVGVRFTGDTRGNPWYLDITGALNVVSAIQMVGQNLQADTSAN